MDAQQKKWSGKKKNGPGNNKMVMSSKKMEVQGKKCPGGKNRELESRNRKKTS